MTNIDKMRQWLMTFPQWEGTLTVDALGPEPGCGLFPGGIEELWRKQNLLGQVRVRCREHFTLRCLMTQPTDEAASWLLNLQQWVQQQSAQGLAPTFGDDPATEQLTAQKGHLEKSAHPTLNAYCLPLTAEYTKST